MARQAVDMTGERYGRLVCIAPLGSTKTGMIWECKCDCGNLTKVVRSNLVHKKTISCGCYREEQNSIRAKKQFTKHGRTSRFDGKKINRNGTYTTWEAMMMRCNNPNSDWYHRYGGRGIKVCERWNDFNNFVEDMGERPLGKTLDRINPDGNYELINCKWSTPKEQANNRSCN